MMKDLCTARMSPTHYMFADSSSLNHLLQIIDSVSYQDLHDSALLARSLIRLNTDMRSSSVKRHPDYIRAWDQIMNMTLKRS